MVHKSKLLAYLSISISVLFRSSFKTIMFSKFLKVTRATSNFINKVYNGGFVPEFSVSMSKEIIALIWDYIYETRKKNKNKKQKKSYGKISMELKYDIFLQWNTKRFLQKFSDFLNFGSCQNCMNSVKLVAEIQLKP